MHDAHSFNAHYALFLYMNRALCRLGFLCVIDRVQANATLQARGMAGAT